MQLPIDFFNDFVPELIKNNIRVEVMGDVAGLPKGTQDAVTAIRLNKQRRVHLRSFKVGPQHRPCFNTDIIAINSGIKSLKSIGNYIKLTSSFEQLFSI